jgi:hypothetical protein
MFIVCFRYVNYCVPVAVVKVTRIIRRGEKQWAKCDNLIVSMADYINEATFRATTETNECRFQKSLIRIYNNCR